MKYNEDEVTALINAVEHARQIQHEPPDVTKALSALIGIFEAQEPFRAQPARVGYLSFGNAEESTMVIELTDPVRLRLSETAGVDRFILVKLITDDNTADEIADSIMQLIKDAAPLTEDL